MTKGTRHSSYFNTILHCIPATGQCLSSIWFVHFEFDRQEDVQWETPGPSGVSGKLLLTTKNNFLMVIHTVIKSPVVIANEQRVGTAAADNLRAALHGKTFRKLNIKWRVSKLWGFQWEHWETYCCQAWSAPVWPGCSNGNSHNSSMKVFYCGFNW